MVKTNLESFSEKVAATSLGLSVDDLNHEDKLRGIDVVSILALVQVIGQIVTTVMQMCPAQANLTKSVSNPSWMQKVLFRVAVSREINQLDNPKLRGMSGKIANAFFAESVKLTEPEVQKVVDEVTILDNWLI